MLVDLPGDTFTMGSDDHYPEEAPTHPVRVGPFSIDAAAVTNAEFAAFVDATGYVTDDGDLAGMRFDHWKFIFLEQRTTGTLAIWLDPYVELRAPKIYNLRTDPFEKAEGTSNSYYDWMLDHIWLLIPAQTYVAQMLESLIDFPPRQTPATFSVDQVMAKLKAGVASS